MEPEIIDNKIKEYNDLFNYIMYLNAGIPIDQSIEFRTKLLEYFLPKEYLKDKKK